MRMILDVRTQTQVVGVQQQEWKKTTHCSVHTKQESQHATSNSPMYRMCTFTEFMDYNTLALCDCLCIHYKNIPYIVRYVYTHVNIIKKIINSQKHTNQSQMLIKTNYTHQTEVKPHCCSKFCSIMDYYFYYI